MLKIYCSVLMFALFLPLTSEAKTVFLRSYRVSLCESYDFNGVCRRTGLPVYLVERNDVEDAMTELSDEIDLLKKRIEELEAKP